MSIPNLLDQLGPAPFRFTPTTNPMVRRAFTRTFCALAVAIVLGCSYWVFILWSTGQLTAGSGAAAGSGLSWSLAALALMAYTLWCILNSMTTLSSSSLEQTFVWNKKLDLRELAYVKLIRIPGLDWLIAPRLYCRTLLGKFAVFYTSDAKMVAEFERLRDELSAFRKMR